MISAGVSATRCGSSSSPTSPGTTGPAVSGVLLSAPTIGVGGTAQGTVTVAAAPTAAASISLTSSNPAVLTVQSPVTLQAGASTAAFTVTGVSAGTANVTASLNGSSSQSASVTVARVAISALTLSATTVVGGNQVTGTVTLSAPAPVGGAAVAMTGSDPLTVPASVTVPAGASSATFTVMTRLVGGTIPGTVTATYGGASMSAALSVTKPTVATASFGITGPTETETCAMANGGNTLNCFFNGSTSTAPGNIVAWDWSYRVGTTLTLTQTTAGPQLTMPPVSCSWLPPPPLPAGGTQWLPLTVSLKVHDDLGNVSAEVTDSGARLFPQGVCGY
jgi:trimeric autotransporter adhesin